ncbi:MAG: hypothetical protein GY804_14935 [Alphaproteobacteria bacterium]|nr:hypothetical protein [Alphaproteobacteria bacterium]
MQILETIKEIREDMGNNESAVEAGVYKTTEGFMWVTYSQSGTCKRLATAIKKAGL